MGEEFQYAGEMLGATLFVVGMIVSWVVWRRRGAAYGLRGVSWSLLVLAAGLIGLIEALWGFVSTLLGSILNPIVWAGFAIAGLGVVLYIATGVMKARKVGTTGKANRRKAEAGGGESAAPSADQPGELQQSSSGSGGGSGGSAGGSDDFSDIEELLRKRGIG